MRAFAIRNRPPEPLQTANRYHVWKRAVLMKLKRQSQSQCPSYRELIGEPAGVVVDKSRSASEKYQDGLEDRVIPFSRHPNAT